ncbi:MAG: glycosyltransferase [Candidatus Saccharimonadales bacterium]
MRIGLFTDTYRPSINGIVFVVESLKKHLEAQGHEVFIFCPASSIRPSKHAVLLEEDEHIVRFPSVKGAFYDDYDTSLFFPPRVLTRVKEFDLDVIHFFTPGQIGLMGVYAAHKTDTPLIAQHCTDLREYVEHYSEGMLLPGLLALITLMPFTVKFNGKDIKELVKLYRPRRGRVQWNIDIVERMVTLVYSKCDAVIALSRKSKTQLESWQHSDDYVYDVTLMPNGVDTLPPPTNTGLKRFREQYSIAKDDEVFGFVGRLGAEKNLEVLIKAFTKIVQQRPKARLLFVGDFEHREVLERLAGESSHPERVTFTGALPRETLGVAYGSMKVFVFPSLTDTQGWVVHEAALSGLPLILLDRELSEVMEQGVNGEFADNDSDDIAAHVIDLLSDEKKRQKYGIESKRLAGMFTEKYQVEKLAQLYVAVSRRHYGLPVGD